MKRKAWLVDIGDIDPVVSFCKEKELTVYGVFLTHCHFDHIYGILPLLNHFPTCTIYTTEYGKFALASEKLNLSRYFKTPVSYNGDNVRVVHEGERVMVCENEPPIEFYETPGHNMACLTIVVGKLVFTGDAFIPGVETNTQLPHSNKELAKKSLDRIIELAKGKIILPGHQINNMYYGKKAYLSVSRSHERSRS